MQNKIKYDGSGSKFGNGNSDGSGHVSGHGSGSSSGDGYGHGFGDGFGYEHGAGDGSGSGHGSGSSSGDGTGQGSGRGSGSGDGDGYGSGRGSGYSHSDGYGSGYGHGYGYGSGFGDNLGDDDKIIKKEKNMNNDKKCPYVGKHVIVRAEGPGVHFGLLKDYDIENKIAYLENARHIHYWTGFTLYFVANNGMANDDGRMPETVNEIMMNNVLSMNVCTDKATKNLYEYKVHIGSLLENGN